jgi:hypothetical protein
VAQGIIFLMAFIFAPKRGLIAAGMLRRNPTKVENITIS